MRKLPRKTNTALEDVLDTLDHLMLVERHRTMAARALSEVSWRLYELRRAIAKEIRADGGSWAQVGLTMGISRQSARRQWHTVDGELGLHDDPWPNTADARTPGPLLPGGGEEEGPTQVPGQMQLTDHDWI